MFLSAFKNHSFNWLKIFLSLNLLLHSKGVSSQLALFIYLFLSDFFLAKTKSLRCVKWQQVCSIWSNEAGGSFSKNLQIKTAKSHKICLQIKEKKSQINTNVIVKIWGKCCELDVQKTINDIKPVRWSATFKLCFHSEVRRVTEL